MWHTHLDFYGYGNDGLKIRREHIKAHIALYNRLSEKLSTFGKPYQIWMEFVVEDAGLDSVNILTATFPTNNSKCRLELPCPQIP